MKLRFSCVQLTKLSNGVDEHVSMTFEGVIMVHPLEVLTVTKNPADFVAQYVWDAIKREAKQVGFEPGNLAHSTIQRAAAIDDDHRWMFEVKINSAHNKISDGKPFSAVGGLFRPDAEWNI